MEPEATLMGSVWGLVLGHHYPEALLSPLFLTYLAGSTMHLGLDEGNAVRHHRLRLAWLSEYSSIHTGIPYGLYQYIETTRGRELWVMGVPFMDSMSFVFLAYAAYSMALVVISPMSPRGG